MRAKDLSRLKEALKPITEIVIPISRLIEKVKKLFTSTADYANWCRINFGVDDLSERFKKYGGDASAK